jgi:glycosyltransferase involved in cell wall biosynthesis
MKKLNLGILADQFINWGGGIDFIRLILNGLSSINETENNINICVFIPYQSEYKIKIKNEIKLVLNKLFGKKYLLQRVIGKKSFVDTFKGVNNNIKVYYYNGTEADLAEKAINHNIDFMLPSFNSLSSAFPIAWAGYIYDFQHKYYPEFFSDEEISSRNDKFFAMLNQAKIIIVNAKSVENDINKFIGKTKARVISLPFCPVLNLDFFKTELSLGKYNLPDKYFMISNQFWRHKDHITAFKAFSLFLDKIDDKKVCLVCTGQTQDDRFPDYFESLQNLILDLDLKSKILILGYIPKLDQLQVLKNCIGIIQPTLFEGGPGGGAVYESVAYGIPSIVSDIPVNKELNDDTVTFFKTGSPEDLACKMKIIYENEQRKYSIEDLTKKNKASLLKFGQQLLSVMDV